MTFGLPELPLKSSVTMDEDICSAIAFTNSRMLTKKTIVERLFSSGELGFDFEQFRKVIESKFILQANSSIDDFWFSFNINYYLCMSWLLDLLAAWLLAENIGDVLVLMKFLGKDESAGTSYMQVIGFLIPDGILLNQELLLHFSRSHSPNAINTNTSIAGALAGECTLFEVSPRFRPLYAKKKNHSELR